MANTSVSCLRKFTIKFCLSVKYEPMVPLIIMLSQDRSADKPLLKELHKLPRINIHFYKCSLKLLNVLFHTLLHHLNLQVKCCNSELWWGTTHVFVSTATLRYMFICVAIHPLTKYSLSSILVFVHVCMKDN